VPALASFPQTPARRQFAPAAARFHSPVIAVILIRRVKT
jgi:hypothetical protein